MDNKKNAKKVSMAGMGKISVLLKELEVNEENVKVDRIVFSSHGN
jgi:hypothetical protein